MFSSKLFALLIGITMMEKISAFSIVRTITQTISPTCLKYTIIGGADDDAEPEKDPWAVDSGNSAQQNRSAQKSDAVAHGPGDLSGYSDEYVEKEVDDLNVDAYDSAAGGIMPGFNLSGLCGDD